MGVHLAKALIAVDVDLHIGVAVPHLGGDGVPLLVGVGHPLLLASGQLIQRRHGGIDVALLDEGPHEPEEKGQQQRPDMGAVHVGIGHDDDLVVPQLVQVKFLPDAGAQRRDHRLELVVAVYLVGSGLLHVQHLAPQGEDGLKPRVTALGGGAACGVALHDIDFCQLRVILVAVPQLIRHGGAAQRRLAADGLSGLAGGLSGPVGRQRLIQNGAGHHRMLLQIHRQLVGDKAVHQRADIGVAQLGLGLALELSLRQLHGDHGGDALPDVLAGDLVPLLDHAVLDAVGVEDTGQGRLEARLVHTALRGVDVIGKGNHGLSVAIVILHGDLRRGVPLGAGHVNDLLVQRSLVAVDPGNELPYAALVAHGVLLLLSGAAVSDGNSQTCVQKRLLPHPGVEGLVVVLQRVKHLTVGLEADDGAGVIGVTDDGHFLGDGTTGELHLIDFPALVDLHLQPLGEGVDHAGAHAVETAGDLITSAAELAAGVQYGIYHLQRRAAGLLLDIHGDTTSVIGDGDGVALVDGDGDIRAVARQRFIDGVVHDLVD